MASRDSAAAFVFSDSDDDDKSFYGFVEEDLEKFQIGLNVDSESDVSEDDFDYDSEEEDGDNDEEDGNDDVVWSRLGSSVDANVGPYSRQQGVLHNLDDSSQAVDFFKLLIPDSFFDHVAEQTNLYAQQCRDRAAAAGRPHRVGWIPTNSPEVKAFFAMNIMFGLIRVPELDMYWSKQEGFHKDWIASIMSCTRFKQMNRYLHLRDSNKSFST